MTPKERKQVERQLVIAYSSWHSCGLSKQDAKAMKMRPGTPCDACIDSIKAHMKEIAKEQP